MPIFEAIKIFMRLFICTFFLFFTYNTSPAQTKIAVKGGATFSTARVYVGSEKQDTKINAGYGMGILFKVPFEGVLHFSPWVAYNRRGYEYTPKTGSISHYKNTIHYIDMVPALSVDFSMGKNSLVISAGPHVSVAVGGTEKTSTGNTTSSHKMKFSTSSNFSLVDLGLAGSIGYHIKKFFVEAGFQPGLANINNNVETDMRNIRNRMISLQVGYFIR